MMDDAMMPIGRVKRLEINQVIVYFVHYSDTFDDYDVSADGQCFVVVQNVD